MVERIRKEMAPAIGKATIRIKVAGNMQVFAEPVQLHLALRHLLANAVQHATGASEITIRCADDATHWQIQVWDNGVGIEEKHHEQAMKLFTRLQHRDGGQGVGAGLALTRRIARRHGGDLTLSNNQPGLQATISIQKQGETS